MPHVYDYTVKELEDFFLKINEKKYRAHQLYEAIYKKQRVSFNEMTTFNEELINKLKKELSIERLTLIKEVTAKDTIKYLFKLEDGLKIETVLMKHNYGYSLCLSTQVGCNMGCLFCESGRLKKLRNLKVYEMVLQVIMVQERLQQRLYSIVLMGIGEPFDNYDNVIKFINIITEPKGLNIGSRHITISTCGIVPAIKRFTQEAGQVNLAISLHAAKDELRSKLMPINKVYNIDALIKAVKEYINKTKRRVTFEYIMLRDINDTKEDALALATLVKGINCYVNLIPYNKTLHSSYQKSTKEKKLAFYDLLKKHKVNVTIRKEFGSAIEAACGQLRSKDEEVT